MSEPADPQIIAYDNGDIEIEFPIIPAFSQRDWMSANDGRAYRCLPLTMANQFGWFLLNPLGFTAEWRGDQASPSIKIDLDDPAPEGADRVLGQYFGNGILTWHLPYIFRTSPGYNLFVHGPPNWIKDGIQPLNGLVESDWLDATFTMNWKFTRADHAVRFEKDEPFCMITPVPRGDIERFAASVTPLAANPAMQEDYAHWRDQRGKYREDNVWRGRLARSFDKPFVPKYDLSYMRGTTASGKPAPEHQTRLSLQPFKRAWQEKFRHLIRFVRISEIDLDADRQ